MNIPTNKCSYACSQWEEGQGGRGRGGGGGKGGGEGRRGGGGDGEEICLFVGWLLNVPATG